MESKFIQVFIKIKNRYPFEMDTCSIFFGLALELNSDNTYLILAHLASTGNDLARICFQSAARNEMIKVPQTAEAPGLFKINEFTNPGAGEK